MTSFVKSAPLAALVVCTLLVPGAALAQERFRVSFAPAVATVSDDAELALGGTFGYRVSKGLWFEGDLTWIDDAAGGFRDGIIPLGDVTQLALGRYTSIAGGRSTPSSGFTLPGRPGIPSLPVLPIFPDIGQLRFSADGSTFIGTMGVRWELPVETARFRPYVAGGFGLNNTDRRFRLSAAPFIPEIDESVSHTGYALNGGLGTSVRVAGQLWADVDARYFRLSQDRDIIRVGGGVSYRF